MIRCRFCNGNRRVVGVGVHNFCEGCGAHAAKAKVAGDPLVSCPIVRCPHCRLQNARNIEADRYECRHCHAVFEVVEQSFVDTRPEINAIKRGL